MALTEKRTGQTIAGFFMTKISNLNNPGTMNTEAIDP